MRRCTQGFTVVEILVAITLLGVGVTAWIGTSAAAVRLGGDARRTVLAAYRAHDRAARVGSSGCDGLGSGSAAGERWSATAVGNGVWLVHAEAAYVAAGAARVATYEILVSC